MPHGTDTVTGTSYVCFRVVDDASLAEASSLVDTVYAAELGLQRPKAAAPPELDSQEAVLLVRDAAGRAAATMTLQGPAFGSPGEEARPLELEASYELSTLAMPRAAVAEVRRVAARRGHPAAVRCLYQEALRLSQRVGVRVWLGLVEANGSRASDAPLVHRVLEAHGLLEPTLPLPPRGQSTLYSEHFERSDDAFDLAILRRLDVPARIRAFARGFRAHAISVPTVHPHYRRRLVVPMRADVAEMARVWLREPKRRLSTMKPFSEQLQLEVDFAVRRVRAHAKAAAVLDGTASSEDLARYYVTAHAVVANAVHFLEQSANALEASGDPDIVKLLRQKAGEERGHDRWLEDDLAAIGFPIGAPETPGPTRAAALYNAFHEHATQLSGWAFLGTAFVLESLAVRCAGAAAENLQRHARVTGIESGSKRGLSFLHSHHEADVGHTAELAAVLDRMVTDRAAQDYALLAARFTATIYADFFG